jgi:hypothetical protein
MNTIPRSSMPGLVAMSAAAAGARPATAKTGDGDDYTRQPATIAVIGVGRGQAASASVVWLPLRGRTDTPPSRNAELLIYELNGKERARKEDSAATSEVWISRAVSRSARILMPSRKISAMISSVRPASTTVGRGANAAWNEISALDKLPTTAR